MRVFFLKYWCILFIYIVYVKSKKKEDNFNIFCEVWIIKYIYYSILCVCIGYILD